MTNSSIAQKRLINQHLSEGIFSTPEEVVKWLGAVQAQDYFGAKWALGMRMPHAIDDDIEQAFTDGCILRTHLLRPTWHFVTPADIRWMLMLTAPRVRAASAYMYRKHGLDHEQFQRSNDIIVKTLHIKKNLTRDELTKALDEAGITTENGDLVAYLMMNAELDGLICSGPRRGNQFTYALLEERVPQANVITRDEALAELSKRYFISRGPATVQDYSKWSGLTVEDAKRGLESIKNILVSENIDGQTYWMSTGMASFQKTTPVAYLMSIFDEYIAGYKNRGIVCDDEINNKLSSLKNGVINIIVLDGLIIGTWKRKIKKRLMEIEMNPYIRLTESEREVISAAAKKYGDFFGSPVELSWRN